MKISIVHTGYFKLDGGAMFGIVPRQLWEKKNSPDENNMCTWAMRCLLVETGEKKILIDTGIGNKQSEKFRSHFEPHGKETLYGSIKQLSLDPTEITDVLLTHLHFDHCGGALLKNEKGEIVPAFPNATYWCNDRHFQWAFDPNMKEKASFLRENFVPLREMGILEQVEPVSDFFSLEKTVEIFPGFEVAFAYGHTEAMMIPIFHMNDQKIVYAADLIPSTYHVSLPYIMSYDIRPLDTLREKQILLNEAANNNLLLIFEHDPKLESAFIRKNEKGRFELMDEGNLDDNISN